MTDERIELDQYMKEDLNHKLQIIKDGIKKKAEIEVTYYKPDEKKDGGIYLTATGIVKKIDEYSRSILMTDGLVIPIDEIIGVKGEIFKNMCDE